MTIRLPSRTGRGRSRAARKARAIWRASRRATRSRSRRTSPALIDRADPRDPIARQFVPDIAELTTTPEERADPIGDDAHSPVEGIVHRYPDRVLLKLVNVCAVYCRFCFRREMVGPGKQALSPRQARCGARLHRAASGHLGSDPDRRRSAGALGAAARRGHAAHRRDRACEDRPPAHAPAGRRRPRRSRRRWCAR